MRRVFILFIVVMMICPIVAFGDSFFEALEEYGLISYAENGSRLVIIGEYDKLANIADRDSEKNIYQYSEDLKRYTSIILLFEKDGAIYLGVELPLVDGVYTENTGSPLMSVMYMQDNMQIGLGQ